jgi:hypothetical protein
VRSAAGRFHPEFVLSIGMTPLELLAGWKYVVYDNESLSTMFSFTKLSNVLFVMFSSAYPRSWKAIFEYEGVVEGAKLGCL